MCSHCMPSRPGRGLELHPKAILTVVAELVLLRQSEHDTHRAPEWRLYIALCISYLPFV